MEGYSLAQQATLETRDAKHAPRTITEQRNTWHTEAREVLGDEKALRGVMRTVLQPITAKAPKADTAWFEQAADRIVSAMETRGATWRQMDVHAEAQCQIRRTSTPSKRIDSAVDLLTTMAMDRSVSIARPDFGIREPAELQRADGASVYTVAGSTLYTSQRILDAEQHLVTLAGQSGATTIAGHLLDQSLAEPPRHVRRLGLVAQAVSLGRW